MKRTLSEFVGPPPTVRDVLRQARRRYRALAVTDRPNLCQPGSAVGLFSLDDIKAVTTIWPLSARIQRWIAKPPGQSSARRRLAEVRRDVAALSAVVAVLEVTA